MIVWGGLIPDGYTNSGDLYDPVADRWTPASTTGAPAARAYHTAVVALSRMIVWGGSFDTVFDTGGVYDPASGTWTATSTTGAPAARDMHTAVSTGSTMIVWGGLAPGDVNTGGTYEDPGPVSPAGDFHTLVPCRLVDTRDADAPALAGGSIRPFTVTGERCLVPSTAAAISANLTVVAAGADGWLSVYRGNSLAAPLVSSLDFFAGQTRANNAIVPLATDGSGTVKVKNGSRAAVHFVLDVSGYFE